jgi:GNAT superfamily N-acetyltransferase
LAEVTVELLDRQHERNHFDCGNLELNRFLRELARQHEQRGIAKTWVAVEPGNPKVLGFITISVGHVTFEETNPEMFARLPKHPMPILHVGRLATSKKCQGRGIASLLLAHAAKLAVVAPESMGIYALELVGVDPGAYEFYVRRGFLPVKGNTMRLYVPNTTLKAVLTR